MKESKENRMSVKGMKPKTVGNFLNYLYTGKANETVDDELLDLAEQYQCWDLKKFCEKLFIEKLTPCNLLNTWRLLKGKYNCSSNYKQKMVDFALSKWEE